jgi:two-component system chemotaxis response regulator CheY
MKTLVVEDDFTSRLFLQELLSEYGECHIALNGKEAVEAFRAARAAKHGYNLICMDVMMPEMDGHAALQEIRAIEKDDGVLPNYAVTIVMTTALDDPKNVMQAYESACDAYVLKPIDTSKLLDYLKSLRLIW